MKDIRSGNDIAITWTLNNPNGIDLTNAVVTLHDQYGRACPFDFGIDNDVVTGTYFGKDQKTNGIYRLLLVVNNGEEGMVTLDHVDAFKLYGVCDFGTWRGSDENAVETVSVELEGDLATSMQTDGGGDMSNYYTKEETDDLLNEHGLPEGGTTGQVLKKKSNENYDAEWGNESGGMTEAQKAQLEELASRFVLDEENKRLLVYGDPQEESEEEEETEPVGESVGESEEESEESEGESEEEPSVDTRRRYFVNLTELFTPNAPTVADEQLTKDVVVDGNTNNAATIAVTSSSTTDATNYYRVANTRNNETNEWQYPENWSEGLSVSIKPQFTNDGHATDKTYSLQVRAGKNGEYSEPNTYDITIRPKCDIPVWSIGQPDNTNGTCTISLHTSKTVGATTTYTKGGAAGGTYSDADATKALPSEDSSRDTGYYRASATCTGYQSSGAATSTKITFMCNSPEVEITRSPNSNKFATSATVKFTASTSIGSTNEYSTDGGSTWMQLDTSPQTIAATITNDKIAANLYQVRAKNDAKGWTKSEAKAPSTELTFNAKKTYYGWSSKSDYTQLTPSSDLSKSVEADTLTLGNNYALTTGENPDGNKYLWVCCTATFNTAKAYPSMDGLTSLGFEYKGTSGDYNFYRTSETLGSNITQISMKV